MHRNLTSLLAALAVALPASAAGTISGTLSSPKGVTAVTAIDRSGDKDKRFEGKVDAKTGRFTIGGLPLKGTFDVIVDAGPVRLQGVDLKVPTSDFEEEQPLTKADVAEITKICKALNKFENEVDVMTVAGNCQHAAVILNKRRTTPFYESKPGEMIWRLELWHFGKPDEQWIKDQEVLAIVYYRERLQKAAFAKKALTLDPALGGLKVTAGRALDLGKIVMPDGKPGIHLRPIR